MELLITFDTETVGLDDKIIYDIGYCIHDYQGNIIRKNHCLVKEVFYSSYMQYAYYYEKNILMYLNMIDLKEIEVRPFWNFIEELRYDIEFHNINTVNAYNILFDVQAISRTIQYTVYGIQKRYDADGNVIKEDVLKKQSEGDYFRICTEMLNKHIFKREMSYMCTYHQACENLLASAEYVEMAVKNKWLTENGHNVQTSAEACYRYITGKHGFNESHTALDDSIIEVEILSYIYENCGLSKGIRFSPYHMVRKVFKSLYPQEAEYEKM